LIRRQWVAVLVTVVLVALGTARAGSGVAEGPGELGPAGTPVGTPAAAEGVDAYLPSTVETALPVAVQACNPGETLVDFTAGTISSYTVPAGVGGLRITAAGGEGGANIASGESPGLGAVLTGTVIVTPGDVLRVLVATAGGSSTFGSDVGGGGGGSFVGRGSDDTAFATTNLLVAAGGGGGEGFEFSGGAGGALDGGDGGGGAPAGGGAADGTGGAGGGVFPINGGAGGGAAAASAGAAGESGAGGGGGAGGNGGSAAGGGGTAAINGGAGGPGAFGGGAGGFGGGGGGAGGLGGGGGGGYAGGGGGGDDGVGGGGGGGGGSSFFAAEVTDTSFLAPNTGGGSVAFCEIPVPSAPAFAKSFAPDTIASGATSTLTFTIDNTANSLAADGLDFTDVLPLGVTVANPANDAVTCVGGTLTAAPDTGTISYDGGGSAAAGTSCTIVVDVTSSTAGDHVNTTGDLTSSLGNSGTASDTLTVEALAFTKTFTDDPVAAGGTVTLEFTITNPGGSALSDISFTDDLDAALAGLAATGLPAADVCGVGSLLSGTSVLSLTGGNLGASGSCTFSVTLQVPAGATSGDHVNTTSDILVSGVAAGSPATDTLTVTSAPIFSKSFAPDTIASGGTSTLTFTIDNTANTAAANNVAFSDDLPPGVTVASSPGTSNGCGGTLTANPDSGTIGYTGGSVAAGTSCTITVDVTSSTAGDHVNTSGAPTSTLGNSGTATDTLTVTETTFSVPSATGTGNITGSISDIGGTCSITSVTPTTAAAVAGSGPPGVSFPHGLLDFLIDFCSPGDTVTFTITFPAPLPAGTQYWKYGPTPSNPSPDWYTIPAIIAGNTVTYDVTDGGLGDDDLTPNGTIDDPAGPGAAAAVPTMPLWALLVLALLLLLAAARLAMGARAPHRA
jgi:uncharacterized repeat protein (TIGR01451 family)